MGTPFIEPHMQPRQCQNRKTALNINLRPLSSFVSSIVKGEPTELCDGNYHRNKTILFWSNGMTSPHRKYMVFPLKDLFFHRKWTFRLKYSQTDRKPLKFIENGCSHWAFRPILIGKHAHRKGNIKHVWTWSQAIPSNFSCLFRWKIAKIANDKCTHRSTNPFDASISIIARLTSLCGYTP